MLRSLVGSEMVIRDRLKPVPLGVSVCGIVGICVVVFVVAGVCAEFVQVSPG